MDNLHPRLGKSGPSPPTHSPGWRGLQALQSHLADRLKRFVRTRTQRGQPQRISNESAFFEADLHYVLRRPALILSVTQDDLVDLDNKARNLLECLDEIVNDDLIHDQVSQQESPQGGNSIYDASMLSESYPRLASLVTFLQRSSDQFSLISSDACSIFKHPHGEIERQAICRIAEWKSTLHRLEVNATNFRSVQFQHASSASVSASPLSDQDDVLQKRASLVIDGIFKEFRRLKCNGDHEVKVKLTEQWYTNPSPGALAMFMSCCQSVNGWHEAECGKFEIRTNIAKEENVCSAIEHARRQCLKLYLRVDDKGLFNLTDHLPPVTTSTDNYESESLDSLFRQKAFCRLSPLNYWDGTATARFDAREKAALALVLSRCLMDFFDEAVDLALHTWDPEKIYFLGPRRSDAKSQPVYVSLKPSASGRGPIDFFKMIQPGNPVLLSFAKLLLEIHSGEKIPLDVRPQSLLNIPGWGHMCVYLLEAQRDESSHYLEAVEGCLNLHNYMLKYRGDANKLTDREMRKVIYEHIVSNLEKALNPYKSKRKRSGSPDGFPMAKKMLSRESTDIQVPDLPTEPESTEMPRKANIRHRSSGSRDRSSSEYYERQTAQSQHASEVNQCVENSSVGLNGTLSRATTILGSNGPSEYSNCMTITGAQIDSVNNITKEQSSSAPVLTASMNQRQEWGRSITPESDPSLNPYAKYTVAIICAIEFEMSACRYMLDAEDPSLPIKQGDSNIYTLGRLQNHNVVLACLPGSQGKGAAATVVTHLSRTFPSIKWRFMVGIGGGVPSPRHDIRLGDVVVSMPEGRHGGVVQYDLGKDTGDKFDLKGFLMPPPPLVRSAVLKMRSDHRAKDNQINENLSTMLKRGPRLAVYGKPHTADILFETDYSHIPQSSTCDQCDTGKAVRRLARNFEGPEIHYGLIASGDRVIRSVVNRNTMIRDVGDILCFEMEAAGLAIEHSCIVIRGISDYADSHKNDEWQYYAAATAAACMKELLSYID